MAEKAQLDWTKYSVGSWHKGGSRDCAHLPTVTHVTHVQPALTALRDGGLKPQLIYDESRLNTDRILVIWLSPNDWHNAGGFRYGNIAFDFPWPDLIDGMRFYWVGAMPYSPSACRILITDQDRHDLLKPYEPLLGDGPWWQSKKTGNNYWNGEYCLEFMLEQELMIEQVSKLRFVKHHPNRCSIDYRTCRECGQEADQAAARFLAGACARRLLARHPSLWVKNNKSDKPNEALDYAWLILRITIANTMLKTSWDGPIKGESKKAQAQARAAMGAYCDRAGGDRKQLLSLFASKADAIESCAAVIEADLDLKEGSLPRKDKS